MRVPEDEDKHLNTPYVINSKDFANEWEELEEVEFDLLDSSKDLSCF